MRVSCVYFFFINQPYLFTVYKYYFLSNIKKTFRSRTGHRHFYINLQANMFPFRTVYSLIKNHPGPLWFLCVNKNGGIALK